MSAQPWQQVKQILEAALDTPPPDRPAYLDRACAGDPELRAEVESLLKAHERAGDFLDSPAAELALNDPATEPVRVGRHIGSYLVEEAIGRGGMGLVYKAKDTRLGRSVALKFMPRRLAASPDAVRRFSREARAASALNHPNVCTIHGVDEVGGEPFIIMEFLQGQTLKQVVAQGPLPGSRILEIATQLTGALQAAHSLGIIHRDIKPANIFVTDQGQAKILDFGVAKLEARRRAASAGSEGGLTESEQQTVEGVAVGTLAYMSPEQARGEELDGRSDLFSLGAVMYEMATGHTAFQGATTAVLHDAILNRDPPPPRQFNPQLPPGLAAVIGKALEKDRVNRYQNAAELESDLRRLTVGRPPAVVAGPALHRWFVRRWKGLAASAFILAALASSLLIFLPRAKPLTPTDSILLADFSNTTGEPVFDGALKQAVAVKLAESPFLNAVSEAQVRQTLRYMGRSPETQVTGEVAREICERLAAKAMLSGSIVALGSHYAVTLDVTNCRTHESLAREQKESASREQVLHAIGQSMTGLRRKLGESLTSIEKYDTPIDQATTSSLEALKSFSLANEQRSKAGDMESIPFFKHAIELDPDFAMAHAILGAVYRNIGESALAAQHVEKAFSLRDRVSERERFYISAHHYGDKGQFDTAAEVYKVWEKIYPRDFAPRVSLANYNNILGSFDRALPEALLGVQLAPTYPIAYADLADTYLGLNRFADARKISEQQMAQGLDEMLARQALYTVAVIEGDAAAMQNHAGNPGSSLGTATMLVLRGESSALFGKLREASLLWDTGTDMEESFHLPESRGWDMARPAVWLADMNACPEARRRIASALRVSQGMDVQAVAAEVEATCGDALRAQAMLRVLEKRPPSDFILERIWIPAIRARMKMRERHPGQAVTALEISAPLDLGKVYMAIPCQSLYLRGQAYLAMGSGQQAAAEFQKVLDHRGVCPLSPYYALARLGLARALAVSGSRDASREAYREFFDLWKNADSDIRILKQAQAEYRELL